VEEQADVASIVFIIPEQKYGVIVSHGAYMSLIKYHDGFEEVVELFDESDFIVSNEIGFRYTEED
jgi:uncharacterized protein with ATP-grasp and redox domains